MPTVINQFGKYHLKINSPAQLEPFLKKRDVEHVRRVVSDLQVRQFAIYLNGGALENMIFNNKPRMYNDVDLVATGDTADLMLIKAQIPDKQFAEFLGSNIVAHWKEKNNLAAYSNLTGIDERIVLQTQRPRLMPQYVWQRFLQPSPIDITFIGEYAYGYQTFRQEQVNARKTRSL